MLVCWLRTCSVPKLARRPSSPPAAASRGCFVGGCCELLLLAVGLAARRSLLSRLWPRCWCAVPAALVMLHSSSLESSSKEMAFAPFWPRGWTAAADAVLLSLLTGDSVRSTTAGPELLLVCAALPHARWPAEAGCRKARGCWPASKSTTLLACCSGAAAALPWLACRAIRLLAISASAAFGCLFSARVLRWLLSLSEHIRCRCT